VDRSQGARAGARIVRILILDDEYRSPLGTGGCGDSVGSLEHCCRKNETCFFLPLREAVVCFARRNARVVNCGVGFLPLLGEHGG
jgi:hypothetical protein